MKKKIIKKMKIIIMNILKIKIIEIIKCLRMKDIIDKTIFHLIIKEIIIEMNMIIMKNIKIIILLKIIIMNNLIDK